MLRFIAPVKPSVRAQAPLNLRLSMDDPAKVRDTIKHELTADDSDVRAEYLKYFSADVSSFTDAMARAFLNWRALDDEVKGDEKRAHVSALVYSAVTLQILSMKLFLSGYLIPAGNLQRQVLETIALALLCSGKQTGILERYMANQYSTNNAVTHVRRHAETLGLNEEALKILEQSRDFYHKYSHPTLMTIATHMSFSEKGLYVGASFDEGKLEQYKKEVDGRVNLSEVFSNFVDGVTANVSGW